MSSPKNSVIAFAAKGRAPTWIGTCSACAMSLPSRSQIAVEKSRLELRICEGAKHRLAHLLDDRQEAMLDHRRDNRIDRDCHDIYSRRASGNGKPNSNGIAKPWNHCGRGGKWPTAATISATRLSRSGEPDLRRMLWTATLPSSRAAHPITRTPPP